MTTTISRQDLLLLPSRGQKAASAGPPTNVFLNPRSFMDSSTTVAAASASAYPIDRLNNNCQVPADPCGRQYGNNNHSNGNLCHNATTATGTHGPPPTWGGVSLSPSQLEENSLNNNSSQGSPESEKGASGNGLKQKRRSLLSFKSFDFHIKSIYSGLRNVAGNKTSQSQSLAVNAVSAVAAANGNFGDPSDGPLPPPGFANNRMPPYLKIEAADAEESENLLIDYPQSPYSSRRNSSHDDNRSSSQLLNVHRCDQTATCRSQTSSPSPYYLSPYAVATSSSSGNIRRSSTSDIGSGKRSTTSSASSSRRPSTTDLLRKARERRGSEARMGRSVSHSGLPRGAFRGSVGGARRTSMAY